MFKVLFWCLAIYFLYRFIFGLVIPVSRTANQLKKKMAEMQAQQSGTQQKQTSNTSNGAYSKASGKGDYLDFEEVK